MSQKEVGQKFEQEAREVTEEARELEWKHPSFVAELFMGNFRLDLIHPYPEQDPKDKADGDAFMDKVRAYLEKHVDADEIDEKGEIPWNEIKGLQKLGVRYRAAPDPQEPC